MKEAIDITTEAELDAALAAATDPEVRALRGEYHRELDVVILYLDDGRRLVIPHEEMQGLENATPEQLADIQIFGLGQDIAWPQLDVDHYLPDLLEGQYATEKWKAGHRPKRAA